jgi:hypothetical protein
VKKEVHNEHDVINATHTHEGHVPELVTNYHSNGTNTTLVV